ncbi:MAG: DNA polymerase III subunit chi [Candidatus Azotimanducaceae bacterium]|uniref:DNA polymerase III subunit chi n=1 Tax=OM182 bacterium TaxID=2510334 RepID=A0A520S1D9_9GAMM|nr:DNA polymerase III subunit chi [Gammaproteobacteria bacterium]RZO76280.1 MAG: DNA polymerase III subunit chi [OM182 bacterium]
MTRINFYQVGIEETVMGFACRLVNMIYKRGHRVHVYTGQEAVAGELDKLLWSWEDARFLPHEMYTKSGSARIKISAHVVPEDHHDVLVNLSEEIPNFFSQFERVAEIVPLDHESRERARENYRFYQDRGYQLEYHQIKGKQDG